MTIQSESVSRWGMAREWKVSSSESERLHQRDSGLHVRAPSNHYMYVPQKPRAGHRQRSETPTT